MWEVLDNFLLYQEFFQPLDRPHDGFYRRKTYPAHLAVASLIWGVLRSYVGLLPIRPTIMSLGDVAAIHQQRFVESPECWSYSANLQPNAPPAPCRKRGPAHNQLAAFRHPVAKDAKA